MRQDKTVLLWWRVARFVSVLLLLAGLVSNAFAEGRMPVKQVVPPKSAKLVDPNAVITINGDMNTISKEALAQSLVGNGIQISNVTATCDPTAAGTFTITGNAGIGLSSGIILSSGAVSNVIGPNDSSSKTTSFGAQGDADLDAILATGTGSKTSYDACVLEFDFIPQKSVVSFTYVFGSEEYNEYVNTSFNDVFGFFVNSTNCAIINDYPVSVNNINNGNPFGTGGPNSDFYINNDTFDYNTQLDGFTKVLTCSSAVNPGVTNHIKLAIADAGDSAFDSDVFIGASSFVSADYLVSVSPSIQNKSGNNTTIVTYVFDVRNLGAQTDTFNLTLNTTAWPTVFAATNAKTMTVGPLAPLEMTSVYVDVTIPKAPVSLFDSATLTATSVGAPPVNPVSATATMTTEALGLNNCLFVRDMPSYYIPGIPMPVSIWAVPTCIKDGDNFWALEDNVPAGWTVSNISNSGVFSGGKVNYDNLPAQEINLTYTVTPPPSQTGTVTFAGTGSVSGIDTPITGDDQAEFNAGDHPADTNNNQAIAIGEYTTYGAYWKSGKSWPYGWNPITAGFVTKAGEIWAKNIGYHFDGTAGMCPDCWVAGPGPVSSKAVTAEAGGTLSRTIAKTYKPGIAMNVDLDVTPQAGTQAYVVEETPPAGWAVSNISDNGNFDGINKKIKWGIFKDAATVPFRTLSYSVTPAVDATGDQNFMGLASFDGKDVTTNTTITDQSVDVVITTKPLKKPIAFKGGKGKVAFTASATLTLQQIKDAISADDLITVDMASIKFAKGKGSLSFTVGPNPTTETKEGDIQIGSAEFKVTQAPTPCMIKSVVAKVNGVVKAQVPKAGGEMTVEVDVYPDTCNWKITGAKVAPCAKGTDPAICLEAWFADPGNFPDIDEIITGDKTFTGTVAATEKPRTLSGKVMITNPPAGKGNKPFTVKQSAK
jgi:hypothetical protein